MPGQRRARWSIGSTNWSIGDALLLAGIASLRVIFERARGHVIAGSDLGTMFIPSYAWWWSRPRWLGGWNPWVFGGYPANGDPLIGHVHPFGVVWAVLRPLDAAAVETVLGAALAAIGMAVYLRQICRGRAPALLGGLSFGLGGFVTSHAVHPPIVRAAMAVPWALAAIEALDGAALAGGVGLAVGAIVLGGHPQSIFYALALVVAYAACLGRPTEPRRLLALAAGLGLGLTVGAATWLPATALIRSTSGVGRAFAIEPEWTGLDLRMLIVPFARGGSGGPIFGDVPGRLSCITIECSGYPGLLPWLMLLAGLPWVVHDRRGRFWIAAGVLALALASGVAGTVPPLEGVRAPTRWLLVWNVASAALAGIGLERLTVAGATRSRRLALAAAALALAGVIVWSAFLGPAGRRSAVVAGVLLAASLATAIVASAPAPGRTAPVVWIAALDLVVYASGFPVGVTPAEYESGKEILHVIADARGRSAASASSRTLVMPEYLPADWAPFSRTPILDGYNQLVPRSRSELLQGEALISRQVWGGLLVDPTLSSADSHVLDLLRTSLIICARLMKSRWCTFSDRIREGDGRFERLDEPAQPRLELFVNHRARPVAWLVHRVRVVDEREAIRLVRGESTASSFDPSREALSVEPIPELAQAEPARSDTTPEPVAVDSYDEDEVRLHATADTPALLVTSDLADPGWTAEIDGRGAPLRVVNYAFRAVVVPAGRHQVTFRYRPALAVPGLALSGAALIAIVAGFASGKRSSTPTREEPPTAR